MKLTRFEMAWARDAFAGIFPGPDGVASMDIEGFLTEMFARLPFEPALGLRVAIWIVALAPIFVLHRLRTIHGLSPDEREKALVRLTTSPLYPVRQLVFALKAIAAFLFAADPAVQARMLAYEPAPVQLRTRSSEASHARVA